MKRRHTARAGLLGDLDRMQSGRLPDPTPSDPPQRDRAGRLVIPDRSLVAGWLPRGSDEEGQGEAE